MDTGSDAIARKWKGVWLGVKWVISWFKITKDAFVSIMPIRKYHLAPNCDRSVPGVCGADNASFMTLKPRNNREV